MVKAGWNNYSVINVQYKNQVVAKRRGAEDIVADSLRTLQLMNMIAERAKKEANDSLQIILPDNDRNTVDSTMIQQSIQRDDNNETAAKPEVLKQQAVPNVESTFAMVNKVPVTTEKKKIKTTAIKKDLKQPKAVMQNKNEY